MEIKDVKKKDYYRISNAYKTAFYLLRLKGTSYYNTIHSVYNLYDDYDNRNFLFVGDKVFYIVDTSFEFADKVTFFKVNDENNIVDLVPFKSNIIIDSGNVSRLDDKNNRLEELVLIRNDESDSYRNINAALLYAQFNYKEAIRCTMFNHYEANFDGKDKVSEGCFKLPFLITLDQFIKVISDEPKILTKYHLAEWDPSKHGYSLALIKACGVKSFVNRKSNPISFSRYYREPVMYGNETFLSGLLRCKGFKQEELYEMFQKQGFRTSIPKDLINVFNGEDENVKYCSQVLDLVSDVKPKNNIKLILKR